MYCHCTAFYWTDSALYLLCIIFLDLVLLSLVLLPLVQCMVMDVSVLFSWADGLLLDLLYLLSSTLRVFVLIVVFLMPAAIQISFGIVINLNLNSSCLPLTLRIHHSYSTLPSFLVLASCCCHFPSATALLLVSTSCSPLPALVSMFSMPSIPCTYRSDPANQLSIHSLVLL